MNVVDLWPEINIEADKDEPIQILKNQAEILANKTKNLITGDIVTNIEGGVIYHTLYLVAPVLDNYRFSLIKVAHTGVPYPLFVYDYSNENNGAKARNSSKPLLLGAVPEANSSKSIEQLYEIDEFIIPEPDIIVRNPDEFKEELRKIFQSTETIRIINSLISQSL